MSQVIEAPPQAVYTAFMTPEALLAWLPPEGMRGEVLAFDAREGGGYRMRLTYDRPDGRGKTSPTSDVAQVRFVELVPPARIVQAVTFDSDELAFAGEMRMIWRFAAANGGTEVTVSVEDAPPGISEADHEIGIRSSLGNLARYLQRCGASDGRLSAP